MATKTYIELINEIEELTDTWKCNDEKIDCGYEDAITDVVNYLEALKLQNIIIMNKNIL